MLEASYTPGALAGLNHPPSPFQIAERQRKEEEQGLTWLVGATHTNCDSSGREAPKSLDGNCSVQLETSIFTLGFKTATLPNTREGLFAKRRENSTNTSCLEACWFYPIFVCVCVCAGAGPGTS